MKVPLWPVTTGNKRAPWVWMLMLAGPWAAKMYFEQLSMVAVTFKVREFVNAPMVITFIGSFNLLFNVLIGATCNYTSDRVWTKWGRRRPFLVVGWGSLAIGCFIIPEAGSLWALAVCLFFFEMLRDIDNPYESLMNEVVPPQQRGTHNATLTFVRQALMVIFFAVLIGQWDNVWAIPGLGSIDGEHVVFWTGGAIAIACIAFIIFGVHETTPEDLPPQRARFQLKNTLQVLRGFWRDVFGQRQWWAIYAVAVSQMIFWLGFGNLTPLLFTEQWGFSKQAYGNILALSTPFTLLICLPVGGFIADRFDRSTMFQWLAGGITLVNLVFYLFLILRPQGVPPSFGAVLTYWLIQTGIGNIGVVCTVAMMFDYVPRNRLGTVCAGIGMVRGAAGILVNNGIGAWITVSTALIGATVIDGEEIAYNYESGFLYLVLLGLISTGTAYWFRRQVSTGAIKKLGLEETHTYEK